VSGIAKDVRRARGYALQLRKVKLCATGTPADRARANALFAIRDMQVLYPTTPPSPSHRPGCCPSSFVPFNVAPVSARPLTRTFSPSLSLFCALCCCVLCVACCVFCLFSRSLRLPRCCPRRQVW
jgi:hypothetical protein